VLTWAGRADLLRSLFVGPDAAGGADAPLPLAVSKMAAAASAAAEVVAADEVAGALQSPNRSSQAGGADAGARTAAGDSHASCGRAAGLGLPACKERGGNAAAGSVGEPRDGASDTLLEESSFDDEVGGRPAGWAKQDFSGFAWWGLGSRLFRAPHVAGAPRRRDPLPRARIPLAQWWAPEVIPGDAALAPLHGPMEPPWLGRRPAPLQAAYRPSPPGPIEPCRAPAAHSAARTAARRMSEPHAVAQPLPASTLRRPGGEWGSGCFAPGIAPAGPALLAPRRTASLGPTTAALPPVPLPAVPAPQPAAASGPAARQKRVRRPLPDCAAAGCAPPVAPQPPAVLNPLAVLQQLAAGCLKSTFPAAEGDGTAGKSAALPPQSSPGAQQTQEGAADSASPVLGGDSPAMEEAPAAVCALGDPLFSPTESDPLALAAGSLAAPPPFPALQHAEHSEQGPQATSLAARDTSMAGDGGDAAPTAPPASAPGGPQLVSMAPGGALLPAAAGAGQPLSDATGHREPAVPDTLAAAGEGDSGMALTVLPLAAAEESLPPLDAHLVDAAPEPVAPGPSQRPAKALAPLFEAASVDPSAAEALLNVETLGSCWTCAGDGLEGWGCWGWGAPGPANRRR
jgi:hypothetical protein